MTGSVDEDGGARTPLGHRIGRELLAIPGGGACNDADETSSKPWIGTKYVSTDKSGRTGPPVFKRRNATTKTLIFHELGKSSSQEKQRRAGDPRARTCDADL